MSDVNATRNDDLPNDSTVVPSSSSSRDRTSKLTSIGKFLPVPPRRLSRQNSIDSTFSGSDISELSFGSTEVGSNQHEGLIRTLSNVSSTFASITGPTTWRSKLHAFWVANYGAFLVLLSQLFGCMMNISTRLLETPGAHGEPMHPFQILFARQSITAGITTCYALWSRSVPHFPFGPRAVRWLLVTRGLFGFLGVFGLYFSLLYLPISEATVLTFLSPIGTCYAFSLLIPGETFSKQQQLAGFVSLVGVLFIARPASLFSGPPDSVSPSDSVKVGGNSTVPSEAGSPTQPTSGQHLQAVGIAMIGVVGAIGAMTSIRSIGTRAHPLLSVNYFSVWCSFVSLLALVVFPSVKFRLPGNSTEWGLLATLGCAGFIMQLLLTMGMSYGSTSASTKELEEAREDLEMQAHTVEPLASDAIAQTSSPTEHPTTRRYKSQKASVKIKGSGTKATSMLYTQMLFALIADKFVFGVTPGAWSWVGSGLILFGAIWVAADGTRKKAELPAADQVSSHERGNVPSKGTDATHDEQVRLLADIGDLAPHVGETTTENSEGSNDVHGSGGYG